MNTMPAGNDSTGGDGLNTTGYRFNSPVASDQNTYIAKLDYKLDSVGKHSLFWRGNLQNDSANGTPQFPGQPPNSVTLANNKGFAAGWTGVLTPALVNTFRYGFTRVGNQTTGVLTSPYEWFRGIDTPYGTTTGTTRIIPVHTIGNDLSWNHRAHDFRFGAVVRLVSNQSSSLSNSYSSSSSNPSWLSGSGNDLTGNLSITSGDLQSFEYGMGASARHPGTGHRQIQLSGGWHRHCPGRSRRAQLRGPRRRVVRTGHLEGHAQPDRYGRPSALARTARLRGERPAGLHQHPDRRLACPAHESCRPGAFAKRRDADHVYSRRRIRRQIHLSESHQLGASSRHRVFAEGG